MPKITLMMIYNATANLKNHAVYQVYDPETAQVVFLGHCAVNQLMILPDLRQCPLFDRNKDYAVTVLSAHSTQLEAYNALAMLIAPSKENPIPIPLYNKTRYFSKKSAIICNETGESFDTVQSAARMHGLSASNLCKHLNHRPGFKSVKGRTYHRKHGE